MLTREVDFFFFQAEDGIRDLTVTGVQTCALPISRAALQRGPGAAPDYGDSLVAGCRFGRPEATVDQDIKMPAVQGLERIGENSGDIGDEEHGCSRTAVDMHLLEVFARLFHTDHHRRSEE